jgi:hypothetical protein
VRTHQGGHRHDRVRAFLYAEVVVAVALALATGHGRLASAPAVGRAVGPAMPGMTAGNGHAWIMWTVIVLTLGCAANMRAPRSRRGATTIAALGMLFGVTGLALSGTGILS